ncbi:MAG: aminotransferase class V-fold PLP-dependent enzyme [Planctomycetota bacterium]
MTDRVDRPPAVYLDHAATSFPKPAGVADAVLHWYRSVGVSGERGDGPATAEARRVVQNVRRGLSMWTGARPEHIAFCSGATEGLNLALRALLRPKHRVLATRIEHSSVVRPLLQLQDERDLSLQIVPGAGRDEAVATHGDRLTACLMEALEDRTSPAPDLLVFGHASNVSGAMIDAKTVCDAARARGTTTLIDASQTIGYVPLDVGADIVVASAHKALHGPPGIGFVALGQQPPDSEPLAARLLPQKQGGTGSSIALDRHPTDWPTAFEAGTPNTPGLFGCEAALSWLAQHEPGSLLQAALERLDELRAGLSELPRVRTFAAEGAMRTPVLSFVHEDYDPLELGNVLAAASIHARTGFHCAPWVHEVLGTQERGTVRLSPGPMTSALEVATTLELLRTL